MKFGCSECLCIAIESHRPELLKSLLQRSDFVYWDMFWAPYPSNWDEITGDGWVMWVPRLHHFDAHSDLSFVGREDCGHMRVDVELQTPFDVLCKPNYSTAYILVSLPLMARWHSSDSFNAQHTLRQSGQFDYSEPQFYHKQRWPSPRTINPTGPLRYSTNTALRCEFESDSEALTVSIDKGTPALMLYQPSSLPCDKIFFICEFNEKIDEIHVESELHVYKFYGKLARVIYEMLNLNKLNHKLYFDKKIQRQFRAVLESGADLNHVLPYRHGLWFSEERRVELFCYDLFLHVFVPARCADYSTLRWINLHNILKFLLDNGLSFFYNPIYLNRGYNHRQTCESLLKPLEWRHLPFPLVPLARAIALQLLALGYGRRELHTGSFQAREANLSATRSSVAFYAFMPDKKDLKTRRLLQSLVDHFDAGPLTLQQLARIAVRRAVGGADFARRVRRIKSHIPPLLFDYVAKPSEYLLTDDEMAHLNAVLHSSKPHRSGACSMNKTLT